MSRQLNRHHALFLVALVVSLLLSFTAGSGPPRITAAQAKDHIGESVVVEDRVASVHTSRKGNTFINFGGAHPNQIFTAVVFSEDERLFPDVSGLEGQRVRVTGVVKLYRGKPEVILRSAEQLVILK